MRDACDCFTHIAPPPVHTDNALHIVTRGDVQNTSMQAFYNLTNFVCLLLCCALSVFRVSGGQHAARSRATVPVVCSKCSFPDDCSSLSCSWGVSLSNSRASLVTYSRSGHVFLPQHATVQLCIIFYHALWFWCFFWKCSIDGALLQGLWIYFFKLASQMFGVFWVACSRSILCILGT